MLRTVAIVRHGEYHQPDNVPSAWLPHPLTEEGKNQARRLADNLISTSREYDWSIASVIHCSQLLRAYETAFVCSKRLEAHFRREFEIREHADLNERCLGSAANLQLNQIDEVLALDPRYENPPKNWKSQADYRLPLPGAESLREAGRRVAKLIAKEQICSEHLNRSISTNHDRGDRGRRVLEVFVGHGAAFRFAAVELGILDDAQALACSMHHARPVIFECDARENWRHREGPWKARSKPAMD